VEFEPGPIRIERGNKDPEAVFLAERKQVVPELHHIGRVGADRPLEVAVPFLRVFEHEAQASDAVIGKPPHVAFDSRDIAAAKKPVEIGPADRIVLADRRPRFAVLRGKIRPAHFDPG
jgi:hypothetical protein